MPFTFGHPAVVLPLIKKRYFSTAGLITGCLTPDFEYFIKMKLEGSHGHSWAGLFYFDLPVGIILLFIYFLVLQNPLVNNLPQPVRSRMYPMLCNDWTTYFRKHWLLITSSIVFGAATHILWDGFTHNGTFFTSHIPLLRSPIYFFFEDYPAYHILQHVSTGVGLSIVFTAFFCLPEKKIQAYPARGFWAGIIVVGCFLFAVRISYFDVVKIGHAVVVAISAMMYALLFISLIYRKKYLL